MHHSLKGLAVLLAAIWQPGVLGSPVKVLRTDEPCKQVHDYVAKWMADNHIVPKNLSTIDKIITPAVPAVPVRPSLAYACLKSIPLHQDTALAQLKFLRPLFQWQSSIEYLLDPPRGYISEPVDLIGGLDDIAAKLEADGGYTNEFEFLADLHTLADVRVRDGHFRYETLLLDLFTFRMGVKFVSISKDGLHASEIYLHDDVYHDKHGYTPSPVSTIDGNPALEFLLKASVDNGGAQDPDARFNGLFPSLASSANLIADVADTFIFNLPDATTVTLQNGTTQEFTNTAFLRGNFTNITSGADLYNAYGQGNGTAQPLQTLAWLNYLVEDKNFTTTFLGYPKPITRTESGTVAGFFLPTTRKNGNSTGSIDDEVAILAVNGFVDAPNPANVVMTDVSFAIFANATATFLRAAVAANKTKLVLDLQDNGGGQVANLASLYFSLFPDPNLILPLLFQVRAQPELEWVAKQIFEMYPGYGNASRHLPVGLSGFIKPPVPNSPANGSEFTSFEDFYGPFKSYLNGGNYTSPAIIRTWDMLHLESFQFRPPFEEPPFQPDNIVILTDGQCASACAILTDILVNYHGIRTVAIGGRPIEAPMQAIGEIKGGPVETFTLFPSFNSTPKGLELPPRRNYKPPLRTTGFGESVNLGWGDAVSFNLGNAFPMPSPNKMNDSNVLEEVETSVPLQFRYEAANCKLFYTWEMARDITAVWKAVVEVTWKKGKCVKGSTTEDDGTMGGIPGFREEVVDRYQLPVGPGSVKN
ncbi:hypothetical protein B0H66DRAFT_620373 [Apodospora peruviana]|uniref:CPAF-like PDZ domain-containing protein n=1 Tax=Apodospora peruviana TaxID=516989 RepID=A0AAE0ICV5_9PEZI|nr:hypothetical protein B0H66DRAFT_620373 [Apodospora peruviana]